MKPLKLVTKAFGPYSTEQVIDFRELGTRTLFLIHGPTGAGKTTILDGISFALYGVCSGQDRDIKRLRSDHADPAMPTEVTFDFLLGNDRYRIFRKPEQQRPKKRGGMTKDPAKALMWRRTGLLDDADEGTVLASKWTSVTDQVETLLGFRSDQFRQVVMLPQGEFRRLLLADSKQRQEILEVLFQTQLYRRIEDALKQRAKDVKDRIADADKRLALTLEQAESPSLEALREQQATVHAQLLDVRKTLLELTGREKECHERVNQARQIIEKLRERDEARVALLTLEKRVNEVDEKRAVLEESRQAAALAAEERILSARTGEARDADHKWQQARQTTRAAVSAKQKAEGKLDEAHAKQPLRDEARRRLDRLQDLTGKVEQLEESLKRLARIRKEHDLRTREWAALAEASEECTVRWEKVRDDLVLAEKAADRIELLEAKFRETEKAARQIKALAKLRSEDVLASKKLSQMRTLVQQAVDAVQKAQNERKSLERTWIEGQAAILAARLAPGEPCPVCGSTEHPIPARSDAALPDEKALKGQAMEVERLEQDLERLKADAHDQEKRVSATQVEVRVLEESLEGIAQCSPAEIEADRRRLKEELAKARDARNLMAQLAEERDSLVQHQAQLRRDLAVADEKKQKSLDDLRQAQAEAGTRKEDIPEELQKQAALARAKKSAEDQVRQLTEAFEQAREEATNAIQACTASQTAESDAAANALEAANRLMTQQEDFRKRLSAAGFPDEASFRAAKRTAAEIQRVDSGIRSFDQALGAAKDRASRASSAAGNLEIPDLEGLEQAAVASRTKLNVALQAEATLVANLKRLKGLGEDCTRLAAHLSELEAAYLVVGKVAEVANGNNRERITFQRFVLSALLDDVLGAASSRLRIMSNGRFHLQRVTELGDRRTAGGLDLEVHDHYTGTARPVSTLSGGESFLASLSLALGLADVVQAYSGGIQLDAVFVDEGFGSLDPEALDLALQALVDLRRDGRLVGIISHVPSLREIIDARLEVAAGRSGSTARFVVGCSRDG